MKINETTLEVWQEFALKDQNLSRIIFPAYLAKIARLDSKSPVEISNYYDGVILEDTFYVTAINRLCCGKPSPINDPGKRNVEIHPTRLNGWVFQEEVVRTFACKQPNVSIILCHNHPRTEVNDLRNQCFDESDVYLSILEEERLSGDYNYLANGEKPSIDEVVNEVISRLLSHADVELTPGCAHILITDTYLPGRPLSILNGYKIVEDSRAVGKLQIELLHKQPKAIREWYRMIVADRSKSFDEVSKRHEEIYESLSLNEKLMPTRIPHETYFI